MTQRLYYHDSFLYDFEAYIAEAVELDGRNAVVLDQTAFYPTSGGQVHDTGRFILEDTSEVPVIEVADEEMGRVFHYANFMAWPPAVGTPVRGCIDPERRRDHMQQHSGQHVLSAAFIRLFNTPTVSFHMGAESCTIDLETNGLSSSQAEKAERLANEILLEDRPVTIRFVPLEEARQLGLRKLPPKQKADLRLIDIADFDLTACGGTHVRSTGQIGTILLRKIEKAKQGVRVEFICGIRAVATARKDYTALAEAAGIYSAHLYDVAQQVRKSLDENKAAAKAQHKLLEDLAQLHAERALAQATGALRVIVEVFPDRDAIFIKLLAQKLTAGATDVIALLAAGSESPALVFARSRLARNDLSQTSGGTDKGQTVHMGQLLKDAMARLGGRGGGTPEMAQGGLPAGAADFAAIEKVLRDTAAKL
jgi:alanyl-tRNA synthetase